MRAWDRAPVTLLCGFCGKTIPSQAPVYVITLQDIKKPRYRCQDCAGEAVPDLSSLAAPKQNLTKRMKPLKQIDLNGFLPP